MPFIRVHFLVTLYRKLIKELTRVAAQSRCMVVSAVVKIQ